MRSMFIPVCHTLCVLGSCVQHDSAYLYVVMKKVLHIMRRKRKSNPQHYCKPDDFRAMESVWSSKNAIKLLVQSQIVLFASAIQNWASAPQHPAHCKAQSDRPRRHKLLRCLVFRHKSRTCRGYSAASCAAFAD